MIKIISIKADKTEQKVDSKGKPCINYQVQAQLADGEQKSAYITSYAGELRPGMELDIELKEKVSGKSGKSYLSGYYYPPKGQAYTPPATPAPVQQKAFTPEELEGVMEKCIDFAGRQIEKLEAFGVPPENITAVINSLFIAQTSHGHRPNDWTVVKSEPAIDPDNGFANPDELERQRIIAEIKEWVKTGKVTESNLGATRKLVMKRSETLDHATVEELKEIYNKVKPAGDF